MLFHEVFGLYYHAVGRILTAAVNGSLTDKELYHIARTEAFSESALTIVPALQQGDWPLLRSDHTTPLRHTPTCPLSLPELRWLKSLLSDPRALLFPELQSLSEQIIGFEEIEPLFSSDDIVYFDRYNNGDPFTDPKYVAHFHTFRAATEAHTPVQVEYLRTNGRMVYLTCLPNELEYSEKDDCFRVHVQGCGSITVLRLSSVFSCTPIEESETTLFAVASSDNTTTSENYLQSRSPRSASRTMDDVSILLEVIDERNALERALLHFAHFRKEAEHIEGNRYQITICYSPNDESELLIRVLSFGPLVRVLAPHYFVELLRERLMRQYLLLSDNRWKTSEAPVPFGAS